MNRNALFNTKYNYYYIGSKGKQESFRQLPIEKTPKVIEINGKPDWSSIEKIVVSCCNQPIAL